MVDIRSLVSGDRVKVSIVESVEKAQCPPISQLMGEQIVTVIDHSTVFDKPVVFCVFKGVGPAAVFEDEILEKMEN